MATFGERMRHVDLAAKPSEHSERPEVRAGRDAEIKFAEKLLELRGVDEDNVRCGVRVPRKYTDAVPGCKGREIDVVIVTVNGIAVIEIKNWSGSIELPGDGTLRQTRRNGDVAVHDDPIQGTRAKAKALCLFLASKNVRVAESDVAVRVAFVNSRLEIPKAVRALQEVIPPEKVAEYISSHQRGISSYLFGWMLPTFLGGHKLSAETVKAAEEAIATLPTWDVLELNGGRKAVGDFREMEGCALARRDVSKVSFEHSRSRFLGTIKAVFGVDAHVTARMKLRKGGHRHEDLPVTAAIVFQECSSAEVTRFSVNDAVRLELSV